MRIGIGFDVHRLVEGRSLWLGGVHLPGSRGLLGHSDGDVLIHAICDAILGAISEGDIGVYYPDSDKGIAGIESTKILSHVIDMSRRKGYTIVNIDAVVAAEEPKIYPHRKEIIENLARILEVDPRQVSVKGKTTEGLGFVGRKEGMAAYAVALLEQNAEDWRIMTGE